MPVSSAVKSLCLLSNLSVFAVCIPCDQVDDNVSAVYLAVLIADAKAS